MRTKKEINREFRELQTKNLALHFQIGKAGDPDGLLRAEYDAQRATLKTLKEEPAVPEPEKVLRPFRRPIGAPNKKPRKVSPCHQNPYPGEKKFILRISVPESLYRHCEVRIEQEEGMKRIGDVIRSLMEEDMKK